MSDSENTPERAVNGETSGVAEVRTISSPRSIEKRKVACITEQQKVFNKVPNAEWSFAKLFGDMEHVAAAELVIPVGYRKPARNTRENIFVFYVIRGVLRVTIHQTEMVLTEGSSFMVPQENEYFVENIGELEARLFFTQARFELPMSSTVSMI